jgi:thiol-disulfide isomerase/thioredoxin
MTGDERTDSPGRVSARTAAAFALAALAGTGLAGTALLVAAPAATATPVAPTLVPADAATVLKAVRAPGANAVVVNLWASWCPPCREEFPDILKVARELKGRGVRLVLVSGDFDAAHEDAIAFLKEHGVDFPSFIKTGGDEAFINGFEPTWSGMLPTTLVYDGAGRLRHRREGVVTYKELRTLVLEVVDSPGVHPGKESGS